MDGGMRGAHQLDAGRTGKMPPASIRSVAKELEGRKEKMWTREDASRLQ